MAKNDKLTFVIGHKNPDTDSIAASIAYANLKNTFGKGNYVAMRCGNISSETQYVLDRFGFKAPKFIGDVRTQVRDMEIRKLNGVSEEMSLKEAWKFMKDNNIRTLCVTEDKNLKGLITTGDIMDSYMGAYDSTTLAKAKTSYKNIVDTLDGELIVGDINDIQDKGKVIIGAGTPDVLEEYIKPHDIVILGDRYENHLCAIEMEADCIIVCAGSKVTKTIKILAEEKGCKIITTPHDTFIVARLIYQSMPVRFFMKTENLLTFKMDDYIDDIQPIMASTRHRYFPIVNSAGKYKGVVSRRNFLGVTKKQLILVDHNEKSQAVNGMESADILEIIDHHRLGTVSTNKPIFFRNEPLGSTCTILYLMYLESGTEIPPNIAGLMLSAIISDTLLYRSPTCTAFDRNAGKVLATIAGVDPEELAKSMFAAGSNLSNKTPEEIIHQDFKKFNVGDLCIGIGQISSMDNNELAHLKEATLPSLDEIRRKDSLDMLFFMMTNIIKESSEVLFSGKDAESVLENGFNVSTKDHSSVTLPGVVSRKKQMLPTITNNIGLKN
ncbi:MAG: putative manganese-dependent inorganic diphosphatase [Eubacterium sp.]|nr:putative manganese-dependent inorganic diphosphatase [Eubacterium sp.]